VDKAKIWRHLDTGAVAHAFSRSDDDRAICGRLLFYSLGQWLAGRGDKRECKACVRLISEGK
jgi:hypothetical protein